MHELHVTSTNMHAIGNASCSSRNALSTLHAAVLRTILATAAVSDNLYGCLCLPGFNFTRTPLHALAFFSRFLRGCVRSGISGFNVL